jgi:hypothetical protein
MAATAAASQAQAIQYVTHFRELQAVISTGDLQGSRQSLSEFQRVAAGAASKGLDPLRQIPVLSKDFSGIRDALAKGDIQAAQNSLSSLQRSLNVAVSPRSQPAAPALEGTSLEAIRKTPVPAGTNYGATALGSEGFLGADAELLNELRFASAATQPEKPVVTSSTFIKAQPELTSFTQKSQVFPTSMDSVAKLSLPVANTLVQARVVVQGLAATQPNAQETDSDGTAFAPTPELMLGSKGMTIPPGAQLRIDHKADRVEAFLR